MSESKESDVQGIPANLMELKNEIKPLLRIDAIKMASHLLLMEDLSSPEEDPETIPNLDGYVGSMLEDLAISYRTVVEQLADLNARFAFVEKWINTSMPK